MTTLLDQDRRPCAALAVRASSLALGLAASVGLQLAGAASPEAAPAPDCAAPWHAPRAR